METQIHKNLIIILAATVLALSVSVVHSVTDPRDLAILIQFRNGLENGELLKWPVNGDSDPCGVPAWPYIYCSGDRVSQIQLKGLGLKGPLPENLSQLSMLENLGLQQNQFTGKLPSFNGLSQLRYAYLDYNNFDSIPSDFFNGLVSLEAFALDFNPINASTGWSLPDELQGSTRLKNLTLVNCSLAGPVPEFLGKMPYLEVLKLSLNNLTGEIPESFRGSMLNILWLNEQLQGLTGPIDVVPSMESLTSLWLHGNKFSSKIPENISNLVSLQDLNLNGNDLVGLIPEGLADMKLAHLDLSNNHFMGPVLNFKASKVTYDSNTFCLPNPGVPCARDVTALLQFLDGANYPLELVDSWLGNDPCGQDSWLGIICDLNRNIVTINLPSLKLSGILSPSLADLDYVTHIYLQSNDFTGSIPAKWSNMKSLVLLDLSHNNISLPLPSFGSNVKLFLSGNPLLDSDSSEKRPAKDGNTPFQDSSFSLVPPSNKGKRRKASSFIVIMALSASFGTMVCLVLSLSIYLCKKKEKNKFHALSSVMVHPRDASDLDNRTIKSAVTDITDQTASSYNSASTNYGGSYVIDSGNLVISLQTLRKATENFSPENELGRGGFGIVYKGELDNGTIIAVKRMSNNGVINKRALDEFQSEITVLSKVRHRNLVSLLGYSVEENERILIYEYMHQGSLSKHLFQWKESRLEPLSWKRRLSIALDIARGMEYLHALAHRCFVHRDLKSSNILLDDDFRGKVSDFGLVKLASDEEKYGETHLAGTFGYLAPEYAVTGKITTKADVFSFGVVLMELLTGLVALDEARPEESQYIVPWFWRIKSSTKHELMAALDQSLDMKEQEEDSEEERFIAMSIVSKLACHCTTMDPIQRPDMGYAVNVLASLVEKWMPIDDEGEECYYGIDYSLPLDQMVKDWQETEDHSSTTVDFIRTGHDGFAESFTSCDGR